jgi:hypothetical protein
MPRDERYRNKWQQWFAILLLVIGCFLVTVRNFSRVKPALTAADSSKSSVVQNESATFSKVWPGLKNQLCPNMIPQIDYGNTLFKLARDEIDMKEWNASTEEPFFEQFFQDFHGGSIFTSPEHDTIIYLSIWKVAHQQLNTWVKNTLGKVKGGIYQKINVEKFKSGRPQTVEILKKKNATSKAPCIITAIRDPVSHFIAGYNEIEYRIEKFNRLQNASGLLFDRYKLGSTHRFEEFVADHFGGPKALGGPERQGWTEWHAIEPGHIYSMSGVLTMLAGQGLKLTSYLPSLHNLGETWPAFVQNTCPGLPESIASTPMRLAGQHSHTNSDSPAYKAATRVWEEEGATARALCVVHAMDYACWENLPDGIPSVCIDVYTSQKFVDGISQHKKN